MDFWRTVMVLFRRWYITLPAFVMTLGVAAAAASSVPSSTSRSASSSSPRRSPAGRSRRSPPTRTRSPTRWSTSTRVWR